MACDRIASGHLPTHIEWDFDSQERLYDESKKRQCVISIWVPGEAPISGSFKTGSGMVTLEKPDYACKACNKDCEKCDTKDHFDQIQCSGKTPGGYKARE